MDRAQILTASIAFFVANQAYISRIRRALRDHDGKLKLSITAEDLQHIEAAKRKADELEAEMYSVWGSNGIE